jgi:hypothetical protein
VKSLILYTLENESEVRAINPVVRLFKPNDGVYIGEFTKNGEAYSVSYIEKTSTAYANYGGGIAVTSISINDGEVSSDIETEYFNIPADTLKEANDIFNIIS